MAKRLVLIGMGKIARDQHVPSVAQSSAFELVASVDPFSAGIGAIPHFNSLDVLLSEGPDFDAAAILTPPQRRYDVAAQLIRHGKHVLLEKPPARSLAEAYALRDLANAAGVSAFQAWHSRFAPALPPLRAWLGQHPPQKVRIDWKEDVRVWHPGQGWIWQAGGLGVFDPAINALSILTALVGGSLRVEASAFEVPSNTHAPARANLSLAGDHGLSVTAAFDFFQTGPQTWDIVIEAADGHVAHLSLGGGALTLDGVVAELPAAPEYAGVYQRFAELIDTQTAELDFRPFELVADAFLLAAVTMIAPFYDPEV